MHSFTEVWGMRELNNKSFRMKGHLPVRVGELIKGAVSNAEINSLVVLLLALTLKQVEIELNSAILYLWECVCMCILFVCVYVLLNSSAYACSQENREHLDPSRKRDHSAKTETHRQISLPFPLLPFWELKSAPWTPRVKRHTWSNTKYRLLRSLRVFSLKSHLIPAKLLLCALLATVILLPSRANSSHLCLCAGLEAVGGAQHMFPPLLPSLRLTLIEPTWSEWRVNEAPIRTTAVCRVASTHSSCLHVSVSG